MRKRLSFLEKIKAFHLKNNVIVLNVLVIIFVVSMVLYMTPFCRDNDILANIALACFTSLLATILAMTAEIYVQYKSMEKDQFLEDIHAFGIQNLNLDKAKLLKELLKDCDKEIWISGYRLILTKNLKSDIVEAVKRGASVTVVVCPPWSKSFELVYGTNEKVMDNYYAVFYAIYETMRDLELPEENYKVYFIDKPIFSDTYKVDRNLVTGPYLHNKDKEYKKIMARDFFSYILVVESKLYHLVYDEYITLRDEAQEELDWQMFADVYKEMMENDYNEYDKIECFRKACITL